ncbi:hypothetical protein [Agaribacter flavus]|uniref:Uncharacterized protein n=1 Tax=Agaribacter flavus TaxID=1902781 RepID=A0ABV7FQS5_9ALTE
MFKQLVILILTTFAINGIAQEGAAIFGDESQAGHRLHAQIAESVDNGASVEAAVDDTLENSVKKEATVISADAKSVVAFDIDLAKAFYTEMLSVNSLIEVTKILTEISPEKAVQIITLGVAMYPDYAQEVVDGVSLAGVMSLEDVSLAAIQAGADPSSILTATAAGGAAASPIVAVVPLGTGIGAGGAGGGDTTASTN